MTQHIYDLSHHNKKIIIIFADGAVDGCLSVLVCIVLSWLDGIQFSAVVPETLSPERSS